MIESAAQAREGEADAIERLARRRGATDPFRDHEAVRRLLIGTDARAVEVLLKTARDRRLSEDLRAEALVALAARGEAARAMDFLGDPAPGVRVQAARVLRLAVADPRVKPALARVAPAVGGGFADAVRFALARAAGEEPALPQTPEAWSAAIGQGGDVEAGRRVFFDPGVGCVRCHTVEGVGGRVGPELSTIGRGMDRAKVLRSILAPSAEIAPQWIAYEVTTKDGARLTGTLEGESVGGALTLATLDGRVVLIPGDRVAAKVPDGLSAMPEGLAQAMSVAQMRDLVAFLVSRRQ